MQKLGRGPVPGATASTLQQRWRQGNAPHLVALVKAGIEFPNGQAEMLQSEPEPEELFVPTPWILAASGVPIHSI